MPEVVGFVKCPVCGSENQELRVNKNRKLYVYCDNGCALRFNSRQSREWLAKLAAGKSIFEQNLHILPIKSISSKVQHIEKQEENGGNIKNERGSTINGRTNGEYSGNIGNEPVSRPGGRGWFADWLGDDDE